MKSHRRAALRKEPLTEAERVIVARNVPSLSRLDEAERFELEGLVRVFLDEKSFEGCAGLVITDEIRVTIAAEACLLLLHREAEVYPDVDVVLVYPGAYRVPAKRQDGPVVIEGSEDRLGESWSRGVVVLAWDHIKPGGVHLAGQNLVLHEFAHQLDGEEGSMNGTPHLASRASYASWGRILGQEFDALALRLHSGGRGDIDAYGATNPAEFFAVVTELFFENPRRLKARHAALYAELVGFYRQDPAASAA